MSPFLYNQLCYEMFTVKINQHDFVVNIPLSRQPLRRDETDVPDDICLSCLGGAFPSFHANDGVFLSDH